MKLYKSNFGLLIFIVIPIFSFSQNAADRFHPALNSKQINHDIWFSGARADFHGSMKPYTTGLRMSEKEDKTRNTQSNTSYAAWQSLGPSQTTHPVLSQLGLLSCIWIDTSNFTTLLAGSNTGGIFKTTDGGLNWGSLSDTTVTTGVLGIAVEPENKDVIYIGTGHFGFGRAYGMGVMKSLDGGLSWHETGLNSETMSANFTVRKLELTDPGGKLLALINTEFRQKTMIYRTADSANTWVPVFERPGGELFNIRKDPNRTGTFYATGNCILLSQDDGLNWEDITTRLPLDTNYAVSRAEVAQIKNDPDLMLVAAEVYDTTGAHPSAVMNIYRSVDNGLNFTRLNLKYNPFAGFWKMEFAISPAHHNEIYLGGIWLYKYRIEDDSVNYIYCSDHKYHKDVRDLKIFPSPEADLMYMANDGGVSKSETGAESWVDITRNGLAITQFHNITIGENSPYLYGGPQDANTSFYNFDTKVWSKNAKVTDAYEGLINHKDPNIVYMVNYPPKTDRPHIFLLKSADGGQFFDYYGIPDSTEIGRTDKPLAMDPVDPDIIYVGVKNVWKSTDAALNFHKISNFPDKPGQALVALRIAPSNPQLLVAAFDNPAWGSTDPSKLWITPDGGNHWLDITPKGQLNLDYAGIADVTIHPGIPQKFWISLDREWDNRRVYVTSDGGQTYQNYSEGLPPIPVNTIAFINGAGYDVLLAATDIGVYYRDETMSQWELFGQGLPRTIVSDIKINYSRKKIIAGTFGRGLWETDLCLPVIEQPIIISDTVEWNSKRKILQDVTIQNGGLLKVTASIEMGLDRTISVMPGGILTIDRGTLTNDCSGMWNGIRVYGSTDFTMPVQKQGIVNILHGGSIQFADSAIVCVGLNDNGSPISHRGGGIIKASNAKIVNNKMGIVFNASQGKNPSSFLLCQFAINKIMPDGTSVEGLISMNGTSGVTFTSCQFENTLPVSSLPYHDRGIGIDAFNSCFQVDRIVSPDSVPFGVNTESVFRQLAAGIRARTSAPYGVVSINNTRFDRNLQGIYCAGLSIIRLTSNNFNINSSNVQDTLKPTASGIYLDYCPSFIVSGNIIKGPYGDIIPKSKTTGIIINNAGPLNNLIAGNRITNVNYGIIAQQNNRNSDGSAGLRITNNWFNKNEYDICANNDSTLENNGLALHQGAGGSAKAQPASNHFSHNTQHRDSDIHNAGGIFYYYYTRGSDSVFQKPLLSNRIYPVLQPFSSVTDSGYIPPYQAAGVAGTDSLLLQYLNEYAQLADSSNQLIDGGNTTELLDKIIHCSIAGVPELAGQITALSPYVSNQALKQLLRSQHIFSNMFLYKILVGNTHFLRYNGAQALLNSMIPPFENYQLAAILQNFNRFSNLERINSRVESKQAEVDFMRLGLLTKSSLTASSTGLSDDFENLSLDNPVLLFKLLAVYSKLNQGETVYAHNLQDQIFASDPGVASDVETSFKMLFELNRRWSLLLNLSAPAAHGLTDTLIYMFTQPDTKIYATNMLSALGLQNYSEPYIFPDKPENLVAPAIPPVTFEGSGFSVYPVPAKSYLIVDYFSETGFSNAFIRINDANGRLVRQISIKEPYGQQHIDVSLIQSGTYLFSLVANNEIIGTKKVIISR